jgi:hypothetical protein
MMKPNLRFRSPIPYDADKSEVEAAFSELVGRVERIQPLLSHYAELSSVNGDLVVADLFGDPRIKTRR